MKKFFYQENDDQIEVVYEDDSGFVWICDCGESSHSGSVKTAKLLVKLLNKNLKEMENKQ